MTDETQVSHDYSDEAKYPDRYAHFEKVHKTDAEVYLNEWHNKGYSGDYVPEALNDYLDKREAELRTSELPEHTLLEREERAAAEEEFSFADDDWTDKWDAMSVPEKLRAVGIPNDVILEREERVTDPETGGEKGRKPEQYALIPVRPLAEVARVYGHGAKKYDDRNWERGYAWSLSYSALQRHLNAFWGSETYDPESGIHHLAHAVFHCLALMEWNETHLEKDDRP